MRYIFLHIPKTGGTCFRVNVLENKRKFEKPIKVEMGHHTYYGMTKGAKYIMFFRHPLGRTLSHYNERPRNDFEGWFTESYHNFQTKWLMKALLKKSGQPTKEDVEEIKRFIKRIDYVILTENLNVELGNLLNELGLKKVIDKCNHSKEYFKPNEEQKKLILSKSKFDLEIYNYIKNEQKRRSNQRND